MSSTFFNLTDLGDKVAPRQKTWRSHESFRLQTGSTTIGPWQGKGRLILYGGTSILMRNE